MSEYAKFSIKIDNTAVESDIKDDVLKIFVDSNLHLPDMVVIELYDDDLEWVDDSRFDLGKAVEISYDSKLLFKGELTSIEPEFSTERATLTLRGYDLSHRLHRGQKTQTFLKTKDSDAVSTLAKAVGLTVEVDSTAITHEYLIQHNQTDMEFILSRARRLGYQVYTGEGKLKFKKGGTSTTGPEMEWGTDLLSFKPRWAGTHQAEKFSVYGWHNENKQEITGTSTPQTVWKQSGLSDLGGDKAKSSFKNAATAIVLTEPVATVDEANALALALSHEVTGEFVQAEGRCLGDPTLKAGCKVKISGVGKRFGGDYYVTAATHIYNNGQYEIEFDVTGQEPNTLRNLLDSGHGREAQGYVRGPMIGMVTNLNDPLNIGRFKVKFPSLGKDSKGKEIESTWVRPATPMTGPEMGFMFLPEINDEVLIDFEHGDMTRPYMLGGVWSTKDKPPEQNATVVKSGKVNQRIIHSRSGHRLTFDDTDGQEKIHLYDKTTKNEVIIDTKTNTLTINIEKDINITAKGNISMKATGDINMDCANMNVTANQNFKVNATANIEMNATANATYKATSMATVEGTTSLTLKNAAAQIALSGPEVDVNQGALTVI